MLLGAKEHDHSLAFQVGHIVGFAVVGEVVGKTREQEFTLLLEDDGAATEEDVGLHFVAVLEELGGMFELEVVVMVIGLLTETDLLNFLLFLVLLCIFLFFLLRVEELLVVDDAAYRRVGRCSYFDEVKVHVVGHLHSLAVRIDTLLYVVAYEAYFVDTADLVVDTMRVFLDNTTATRSGSNSCYIFNYYMVNILPSRAGTIYPTIEKADKITTNF